MATAIMSITAEAIIISRVETGALKISIIGRRTVAVKRIRPLFETIRRGQNRPATGKTMSMLIRMVQWRGETAIAGKDVIPEVGSQSKNKPGLNHGRPQNRPAGRRHDHRMTIVT